MISVSIRVMVYLAYNILSVIVCVAENYVLYTYMYSLLYMVNISYRVLVYLAYHIWPIYHIVTVCVAYHIWLIYHREI